MYGYGFNPHVWWFIAVNIGHRCPFPIGWLINNKYMMIDGIPNRPHYFYQKDAPLCRGTRRHGFLGVFRPWQVGQCAVPLARPWIPPMELCASGWWWTCRALDVSGLWKRGQTNGWSGKKSVVPQGKKRWFNGICNEEWGFIVDLSIKNGDL